MTGVAVCSGWNSASVPLATLSHGSAMIIANVASIRMPPTLWTHLPTWSPTIVIQTSAPTTSAVVPQMTQFCAVNAGDARSEDVAEVLRELQSDVRHVQDREQPEVPGDDEADRLVEAELGPLIEAALERHRAVEPHGDDRRRHVEQRDGDQPEDDVRRSLLRGDADPLQADDEEDLREDEIADGQLFAQLGAARPDGVLIPSGRGAVVAFGHGAPDSTTPSTARRPRAVVAMPSAREGAIELVESLVEVAPPTLFDSDVLGHQVRSCAGVVVCKQPLES